MSKGINAPALITVFLAGIVALTLFGWLYDFDNKYSTDAHVAQDGTALLPNVQDENGAPSHEILWLTQGWVFYPDQMVEPGEAVGQGVPIYIGQYFSFSKFHRDGSPYGIGTYRQTVYGNGNYTMLIPEVFSACVVYVDGQRIASLGSLSPYQPYIKDLIFSFEMHGEAEILIQTANHSHYYSGLTYPPAIGSSEAVHGLITIRMLFYGFLVFTSLALAVFAAVIWCGTRRDRGSGENFWLGMLGLSFALRVCYPFIHTLGLSGGTLPYVLENTMAAFGIFCVVRTVSLTCLKASSWPERILQGITGGFVLLGLVFSLWMAEYLPGFVPVYGQILYWYKALIAVTMTALLFRQLMKKTSGQILLLLAGLLVYALSLLAHALCLGRFEPAYTGWFEEWGTYLLILCFAARMALRNWEIIGENRHLNQHLQEEIAHKTESLSKLLEERRMLLSGFAHDLKTPITSITTFTRLVELDNTHLDEESRQYLDIIRRKTKEMQEQLRALHEFTQMDATPPTFEPLDLSRLLREFYSGNQPDIQVSGVSFELAVKDARPVMIYGDRRKLVSVLQNLVYNALSFTPEGGTIRLSLSRGREFAVLRVEDTGSGIAEADLPHIFDQFFTNRAHETSSGMGLFIAKSIITEHGGTIDVASELGKGSIFTIRLPIME